MSTLTPNLNLFKIIPSEDAKKPFNFYEILNDNWDKLDSFSTELNNRITTRINSIKQEINSIEQELEETAEEIQATTDAKLNIMQRVIDNLSFFPEYAQSQNCFNGWISPSNGWLKCGARIDSYHSHVYIMGKAVHSGYPTWLGDWSGWVVESIVPIGFGQTVTMDGNATAIFYPARKD